MKSNALLRAVMLAALLGVAGDLALARSSVVLVEPPPSQVLTVDQGKPLTPELVRKAILRAGAARGWVRVGEKPGLLDLEASSGQHRVVAEVTYDLQNYQVKYKSSVNLDYEVSGDKARVHPRVNKWLSDLDEHIRRAVLAVQNQDQ